MSKDTIYREDAIKAFVEETNGVNVEEATKVVDAYLQIRECDEVWDSIRAIRDCLECAKDDIAEYIPSAERKGEWIDCKEPPSTDRNVFIAYGTGDMKSVCIGHYEHDMKLWYEDKNFFAKPIYDAMYWCEIPQFPARMKGADDEML